MTWRTCRDSSYTWWMLATVDWEPTTRSFRNIDGLVQERRNSSALEMELRLSCTYPSIFALPNLGETWQVSMLCNLDSFRACWSRYTLRKKIVIVSQKMYDISLRINVPNRHIGITRNGHEFIQERVLSVFVHWPQIGHHCAGRFPSTSKLSAGHNEARGHRC